MARTRTGLAALLLLETMPAAVPTGSEFVPVMPTEVRVEHCPRLTTWQSIAGVLLGTAVARTAVAPLELVRVQRMVDIAAPRSSTWSQLRTEWQSRGLRAMYRGHIVNLARIMPNVSLNTAMFVSALPILPHQTNPLERGSLAIMASTVALIPTHPLDVIRTRLAVQTSSPASGHAYYTSTLNAVRRITAEEGIRGLWKGKTKKKRKKERERERERER